MVNYSKRRKSISKMKTTTATTSNTAIKRGRGRPPKKVVTPKSQLNDDNDIEQNDDMDDDEEEEEVEEVEVEQKIEKVKRKRIRPVRYSGVGESSFQKDQRIKREIASLPKVTIHIPLFQNESDMIAYYQQERRDKERTPKIKMDKFKHNWIVLRNGKNFQTSSQSKT